MTQLSHYREIGHRKRVRKREEGQPKAGLLSVRVKGLEPPRDYAH